MSLLRKVNWNVDLFRKLFSDQVLTDIPSELIDWNRVTSMFPYEDWYNVKKIAITGEGGNTAWEEHDPDMYLTATIRTGDFYFEVVSGSQYGADIDTPLKLKTNTLWFRTRLTLKELKGDAEMFFETMMATFETRDDP